MNAKQISMIAIYSEISEVSISKAQQLETHNKMYNEKHQLEVKKLIDKDFDRIKSINWCNTSVETNKYSMK